MLKILFFALSVTFSDRIVNDVTDLILRHALSDTCIEDAYRFI
jgi:hypothetical protein